MNEMSYFAELSRFGATDRPCRADHFFSPAQYFQIRPSFARKQDVFFRFLVILLLSLSFLDLLSLWFLKDLLQGWFIVIVVPGIAVAGGLLAWRQWRKLWHRYETKIVPQPMPPDLILHIVLVTVATIFFVTPGFVSDLIALIFLFPITRGVIVFLILQQHILLQTARMHKRFQEKTRAGGYYDDRSPPPDSSDDDIIDVEFRK